MSFGPDLSDSDSYLSDDGDYYNFKEKIKRANKTTNAIRHVLTEEEKKLQKKKVFYQALCSGNKDTIISLLDDGLDVNIDLQDEWTPLLLSVSIGNYNITQEVLKRGGHINAIRNGITTLMMACNCPPQTSPYEESYKIVKMLVENGANVKSINRKRMTALMFAANAGNLMVVKYLLPISDKEAVDNQRWNALFWAVNGNSQEVAQYLLEEGLNYNITDIRTNTPLDLAKINNFSQIINIFPKDDTDCSSNVLNSYTTEYQEILSLKSNAKPQFFFDIYSILTGVRSDSAVKCLSENNITLLEFLSCTLEDLENWGVKLPYQRERIMGGIHKFHRHPYHPNSLHAVPLNATFSNHDASIQLLSVIKQLIAMEASLQYIRKRYSPSELGNDQQLVLKNLHNIRNKIRLCKITNGKLLDKVKQWDKQTKPADLITKDSVNYRPPWRKILFITLISTITLIIHIRK